MSTSSSGVVQRGVPYGTGPQPSQLADLRSGAWTRLGSTGNLGDPVTESFLGDIADRVHVAARAQGYAQGWAEGRRVALARAEAEAEEVRRRRDAERQQMAAEQAEAVAALEAATVQVAQRLSEALDALAAHTVDVALTLTEAIVGREVATAADPGADALRRVLALVDPQVSTTVRLNPADRAALDTTLAEGHGIVLVADPTVARGDAVAETDHTLVDATIGAALDRVREVLSR